MRIDVHCHVGQRCRPCQAGDRFTFEPPGEYAPFDAYFSQRFQNSIGMRLGSWLMGAGAPRRGASPAEWAEADQRLEQLLLDHIRSATLIDRVVVLAFDQYHTAAGEARGPAGWPTDAGRKWQLRLTRIRASSLYVSNTYVRSLWRRYPGRILFGASIHPYRPDAPAMLDEVAAAGAVLIKWLPPAQNIDARDQRTVQFLRRAGQIGMTMLIHYGGEFSLSNLHPEWEDPSGLLHTLRSLRLEGAMPTVIVAHVATPAGWPIGSGRFYQMLVDAMEGEFADAPLYADISALGLFSRARWLRRLLRRPRIHHKLVHGSDFPVPSTPLAFWPTLGKRCWSISRLPSWIDRDVELKLALGVPEHVFTRASELLGPRIA